MLKLTANYVVSRVQRLQVDNDGSKNPLASIDHKGRTRMRQCGLIFASPPCPALSVALLASLSRCTCCTSAGCVAYSLYHSMHIETRLSYLGSACPLIAWPSQAESSEGCSARNRTRLRGCRKERHRLLLLLWRFKFIQFVKAWKQWARPILNPSTTSDAECLTYLHSNLLGFNLSEKKARVQ